MGGVPLHMVRLLPAAPGGPPGTAALLRQGEQLCKVRAVQPAVLCEKFKTVPVEGVVAGSYLNGAVAGYVQHRHKHRGRGGQPAVVAGHAAGEKRLFKGCGYPGPREP